QGRMVKEGRLEDLLAIENQTELLLRDASPDLVERIRKMVEESGEAAFLGADRPRTTLERLFLEETTNRSD
ncbi:MAG: ABC transporter ATP-binding protein, partial [Verrucomicrobiota bacterium]